jgi:hypothetical protein
MKKAFILACFSLAGLAARAQVYVDGVRLDASNASAYVEAVALRKEDEGYHFILDYGQKVETKRTKGDFLTDAEGRRYEFRSAVDGLNFLFENGWEVSEVYVYNDIRRYLLRRRA